MKLAKIFVCILIIAISTIAVESRRVKHKRNSRGLARIKTSRNNFYEKTNGGGSYNSGYDLSGILAVKGSSDFNDDNVCSLGRFYPTKVCDSNELGDEVGLIIKTTKPPKSHLAKFMFKIDEEHYSIRYRFFSENCEFENPWGYKNIKCKLNSDDDTSSYRIKINLPYEYIEDAVSDKTGEKITACINTRISYMKQKIVSLNMSLVKSSTDYCSNNESLRASQDEANDLQSRINKVNENISSLNGNLNNLNASIAASQKHIDDLNSANLVKLEKKNELLLAIQNLQNSIAENLKSIEALEQAKNGKEEAQETASKLVIAQTANVDAACNSVISNVPYKSDLVNSVCTDIKATYTDKLLNESLPRI